jgi:hypothetical protein
MYWDGFHRLEVDDQDKIEAAFYLNMPFSAQTERTEDDMLVHTAEYNKSLTEFNRLQIKFFL